MSPRLVAALAVAGVLASLEARADDVAGARAAYDRGTAAFGAKRYADAAAEFAEADRLAPSATALTSALTAATLADDPVLAMTLADRADARNPPDASKVPAAKARLDFQSRAGKLTARCAAQTTCTITVDGKPIALGVASWVTAGDHAIKLETLDDRYGGGSFTVTVNGGASVDWQAPEPKRAPVVVAPPPSLPPPTQPTAAPASAVTPTRTSSSEGGISKAWFFVGIGATAALGTVTIWSGVDTLDKHRTWNDGGDPNVNASGRSAQTRTNLLIGATGLAAATTALVGIAFVRWSSKSGATSGRVIIGPGSLAAAGRF